MKPRRPTLRQRVERFRAGLAARIPRFRLRPARRPRREPGRLQQAARRGLAFLLVPLFAASAAMRYAGREFSHWWSQRNGRLFVRGVPFLFVAIGCTYLAVAHQIRPADSLRRDYEFAGRAALDRKNFKLASLCFERLSELDDELPTTVFQLAVAAEGQGDLSRMRLLLERISPPDKAVHAGAHYWRARQILADPAVTAERLREAELQLHHALSLEPSHVAAQALRAQVYVQQNRSEDAERQLRAVVDDLPDLQLLLARVLLVQGRREESRQWASVAEAHFTAQLARDAANHQTRLNLADTKLFQGEHAAAVELLQQGLALSNDRSIRQALARAYIAWADTFPMSEDTAGRKIELLEQGLRADPHNPVLFDRLMRLLGTDGPTSDSARKMLQAQLAQGQAPALVHLMLGTDAGQRGESERAVFHLNRAHEIDPGMSVVGNNLAWYLAHSEPPDLPRALSLMDTIVTRWPDRAEFHDTRGQILIKLERWDDALRDLELALPGLRDNIGLHQALARVYREKKLFDLADEHEQIAARLQGESPTK